MPQLMPLMWVLSIIMWILLFMVLIDLYYYMSSQIIDFEENEFNNINYLW